MLHFGLNVLPGKYGLKLSRDKYAIINNRNSFDFFIPEWCKDDDGEFYTDEWCVKHRENCLINFDLNMDFYSKLDHEDFDTEIRNFLVAHPYFDEITDLNDYNHAKGYYLMILDEYCQIYVGTSHNIMRRIREHWSHNTSFDRLLFPMDAVYTSLLSINCFRALDTTRLYGFKTQDTYTLENEFIQFFSSKYCANRLSGGRFDEGKAKPSDVKQREL